jgi:hypothetical protein
MAGFADAGATFSPAHEERWWRVTAMTMAGDAQLSIYRPSNPRPRDRA